MSKEKRRVPKLRFPGFTEDWEQRKLSDISTKVTTKNVDVHYTETLTNSAEQGIISQVDFFDKEISNKNNINGYYIVENNDFIYNPRISTLAPVGPINRNKLNRTGIMSPLYTVFRASNVDLGFLEWYFQSNHWHRYMKLNGDSGARADRIAIKDSTFFEMPIKTPVNIKEQVLIGETLEKFNQYITLHQRKLEHLKLKKKALLQKLFPKNGERYPELRFPGFTDAWEQCKLSDILVERNEQQVETNEYPLMSFVQGYGVIPKGERYDRSFLVLDQSKKYKRTELGDFIYSSNNLETGSIGINKTGKAVISPVYSIFYGVSIGDSQFIGIMSLLPRFISKMIRFRQGVVYGQWRIHEKDFLDISILIPSVDERTKITKLILSLEELITLHQRKLGHLQLQKKALLQQMFV